MIEERLKNLTLEKLQEVADWGKISYYPEMEKEELVELILESMEEEQEEKNSLHNMAIKIEAQKFNAYLMEELCIDYDEDLTLPERYNETKMMFMPRDPSWGFLYWDVEEKVRDAIGNRDDFESIWIRVYQFSSEERDISRADEWFDIPVQFGDRRRYLNLPETDTWYKAELRVLVGDRESVIVGSNLIRTSRDHIVPGVLQDKENRDLLIKLSGFSTDFGNFPGKEAKKKIPQRIFPFTSEGEK
ncbi:MAG: DUF4912 domain-containing protein [Spirochaetales bacterium]|nr:DUF4912 domain-containing protein [Spirochaetales bacterium]